MSISAIARPVSVVNSVNTDSTAVQARLAAQVSTVTTESVSMSMETSSAGVTKDGVGMIAPRMLMSASDSHVKMVPPAQTLLSLGTIPVAVPRVMLVATATDQQLRTAPQMSVKMEARVC